MANMVSFPLLKHKGSDTIVNVESDSMKRLKAVLFFYFP